MYNYIQKMSIYQINAKVCARFVNKSQAVVIVKNRLY